MDRYDLKVSCRIDRKVREKRREEMATKREESQETGRVFIR